MSSHEWTLSQAATLLNTSQHRLIYLCEKKVVIPDFGGAAGRGSSRRFSLRNLLEFAVALKLRDLLLPVAPVKIILYVLRSFEKMVSKQIAGFSLFGSLRGLHAPELRIIIIDGAWLYFSLGQGKKNAKLYGGVNFSRLLKNEAHVSPKGLKELPQRLDQVRAFKTPGHVRLEVSVTGIARALPLEE